LAEALRTGCLAAAALDTTNPEPIASDSPLLSLPEDACLITPHTAWSSDRSLDRLLEITLENVRAFLGGEPQNQVHPHS